jgi:hypothetical protein
MTTTPPWFLNYLIFRFRCIPESTSLIEHGFEIWPWVLAVGCHRKTCNFLVAQFIKIARIVIRMKSDNNILGLTRGLGVCPMN